ncbi:polysaccharide biosynthesis tyrosine autokinase [Nostoc sp. FACHB-152]|uniref:GumC family protein n=1 Tax=unclassified Nostoc TaxID=2593658 RepID=UPI001686AB34|nr:MULTISPECIES: polysaccharide biosynthesis tyrosine autokinase [unclassified Nostoc]MBD2448282.1 polysaccharide biosynthesis tyrosine autokinase [Nostoc sp. FACHB-152]MBD2467444.1 polysaccharide biosynthesis tyrosine autokinase [Nostoc sp. FACHB-145]
MTRNQQQPMNNSLLHKLNIKQLSITLRRRRFLVLGVSCVVMSVAGFIALNTKSTYQSSMQLLVSSYTNTGTRANNIPNWIGSEISDINLSVVDYSAQVRLMLSPKIIDKAVVLLRPYYPNITVEDIKGKTSDEQQARLSIVQLENKIGANHLPLQVLKISFNDENPVKSQRVLLALQKVYQDYNNQYQKERLNKGLAFINVRLSQTQKEVRQAEKNLEYFRRKHNLLEPESQSKILLESLAEVQNQLQTTRAQLQDVQARYSNLEQEIASSSHQARFSSRLNQSDSYQSLLSEFKKTELILAREQQRYTDESPIIEQLKEQRQNQLVLLKREVNQLIRDMQHAPSAQQQTEGVDPQLLQERTQLQTIALGLLANEKSLAQTEQQLRFEFSKYPSLIAEYNRLLPEVQTKRKQLEQLLQAQQSLGLKIAQGGIDWQVLEEPALGKLVGIDRLSVLLGGLLISPILGIAVALSWGIFTRTIYSTKELQQLSNLRLLGSVPKLPPRGFKKWLPIILGNKRKTASFVETDTWLPCHETLDILYQNLHISKNPLPFKSLMFTSALSGEGKTTLLLGLAASAARMHRRILLIDANLRYPSLHKTLQLSNDWGLSLLLLDETNNHIHNYIQPVHPLIDVLTAGPRPEDTIKLLSSLRMKELLKRFEQTYDLVLVDAPPILGTADARILAAYCHEIVMVGRMGQLTQSDLMQAQEILSHWNLIGIIANGVRNYQQV